MSNKVEDGGLTYQCSEFLWMPYESIERINNNAVILLSYCTSQDTALINKAEV